MFLIASLDESDVVVVVVVLAVVLEATNKVNKGRECNLSLT